MAVLPAQRIREERIVEPFEERTVLEGLTYGLGPAGYDVQVAQDLWLWPFWGRLASTVQRFTMPADVVAFVKDKSTNARRFILVQNTVIEPGWSGFLTLELTRCLPWPVRIRKGTPIAQIIFERLEEATALPYAGRYQDQEAGPVAARLIARGKGE